MDGQILVIEFPEEMTIDEINSKALIDISIAANDQKVRKTFEIPKAGLASGSASG